MTSLRAATSADAAGVVSVYNHFVLRSLATFEESELSAIEMATRIADVQASGLPWLVAIDDPNTVVGYAYASPWQSRVGYRFTVEVSVYVAPDQTNRGLGSSLYVRLFETLKNETDVEVVIGGIALPNAASVALHERMGMRQVAQFERVGVKQGQWLDVGYWQCHIER